MSKELIVPQDWDVRRLRIASEAAGVTLWSWNIESNEIALDDRACAMWGVAPDRIVSFEDLSAHIHPEDLDRVRAAFSATREIAGPYEIDFRIFTRTTCAGSRRAGAATTRASWAGSCSACSSTSPDGSWPRRARAPRQ
jgi:PAS domain-containing protein